jgi:alpha-beta hydrolase superfamily lysophospholipase
VKEETLVLEVSRARLFVRRWSGPGPARAVAQIVHGMGEHSARYRRLGEALVGEGYRVYAHDQRGHGETAASPTELGELGEDGWNQLVADVGRVGAHARAEQPGLPRVVIGHSMGSFALQQYLLDASDELDAAVLSGSSSLDQLEADREAGGEIALDAFNAPFEPSRTSFDWLSRDPDEVDRYVADPFCGFGLKGASAALLSAAAEGLADPRALRAIRSDLPLYVFAGDADPINARLAELHLLVSRYREAGLSRVTTRFYAGGRHEMLNEINREEVTRDLLDWLRSVLPA